MARAARSVVQVERLSDQVYDLIKQSLRSGEFEPGQRLLELELAERYKVSRTPVREALFQLSREGLLLGTERGYVTPSYSQAEILHRLEVKRLLDPQVAAHVAAEAEPGQVKALAKALNQEKAAHAAGRPKAFARANQEFRELYLAMCRNVLLARCLRLVDDQFQVVRARIYEDEDNRVLTIEHEQRLLDAIAAQDPDVAAAEMRDFVQFLHGHYIRDGAEPAPG